MIGSIKKFIKSLRPRWNDWKFRFLLKEEYQRLRYMMDEIYELRSLLRFLLPESQNYQAFARQTKASFEYQWKHLDFGQHLLADETFKTSSVQLVQSYTGLPASWFQGKRVLDAGCGNGRWSWALSTLGAQVTAIDQSASGVKAAAETCQAFPSFAAQQHDLLYQIPISEKFDLVWSYGVVHHTGNTQLAVANVAACVKPGGYLFLMVYGVPRWEQLADFTELTDYADLRQKLAALSFAQKVEVLKSLKSEAQVHGWFDAVSPQINDLYRFEEIAQWLYMLGFEHIQLTVPSRNLHLIAQKPVDGATVLGV